MGDGYLWLEKTGANSKVIDVRKFENNVHINVSGSFDDPKEQEWFDTTTSTGIDIMDIHEERTLLFAASKMFRAVFHNIEIFPTNLRTKKKENIISRGKWFLLASITLNIIITNNT